MDLVAVAAGEVDGPAARAEGGTRLERPPAGLVVPFAQIVRADQVVRLDQDARIDQDARVDRVDQIARVAPFARCVPLARAARPPEPQRDTDVPSGPLRAARYPFG